jgi:hypothetical protein
VPGTLNLTSVAFFFQQGDFIMLHLTNPYRLRLAILFTLLSFLGSSPVQAQNAHTFRLYPDPNLTTSSNRAYFVYEAAPGTIIQDSVLVVNPSSESIHLSLYPADAVTAANGGISIGTTLGEMPTATGSWLQLTESEVTLEPAQEGDKATAHSLAFTLTIPDNIPPGEYAASIVAQPADALETSEQTAPVGVRFIPRTATTVLITIPGPEPLQANLEITTLRAETNNDQQVIVAELSNTGNAGIPKTEGTLTIRETNGTEIHQRAVNLAYFLAGDSLSQRLNINPPLVDGEYDVILSLNYQDKTVEQSLRLPILQPTPVPTVVPEPLTPDGDEELPIPQWMIIAGAVGGLLLLLLLLVIIRLQWKLSRQPRT